MASTPPGAQKKKIEYNIDKKVHDDFMKLCSHKGYAPQVAIEKYMKRCVEIQQIS